MIVLLNYIKSQKMKERIQVVLDFSVVAKDQRLFVQFYITLRNDDALLDDYVDWAPGFTFGFAQSDLETLDIFYGPLSLGVEFPH